MISFDDEEHVGLGQHIICSARGPAAPLGFFAPLATKRPGRGDPGEIHMAGLAESIGGELSAQYC